MMRTKLSGKFQFLLFLSLPYISEKDSVPKLKIFQSTILLPLNFISYNIMKMSEIFILFKINTFNAVYGRQTDRADK